MRPRLVALPAALLLSVAFAGTTLATHCGVDSNRTAQASRSSCW